MAQDDSMSEADLLAKFQCYDVMTETHWRDEVPQDLCPLRLIYGYVELVAVGEAKTSLFMNAC